MADEIKVISTGPDWQVAVRMDVTITGTGSRSVRKRRQRIIDTAIANWTYQIGEVLAEDARKRLEIARG